MKPEDFCNEYQPKRGLYKDFAQCIHKIVKQALDDAGLKAYSITYREKEVEKLKEKIERKEGEGTHYTALEDVEDLAGVRVVAYLDSQKEEAVSLIYRAFETARPRVEPKYDPEGYRGTHFILSLDEERGKMAEYARYKGLKCEIQVVSILYHAWSEIEHDVIYKPGADREKLKSLGLDEIESAFKKIMAQHLEEATIQFDLLYKKHQEVLQGGEVIYSDFVTDIQNAESNDQILSLLSVGDKFSHKKQEEVMQMAEATIKREPIDPRPLHKFGDREIFGKDNDDLLLKCIEIFKHFHVRYWNPERVLKQLFPLSVHASKDVTKHAIEAIEMTAKYDHSYISRYKNLFPQTTSLDFIKSIPAVDRKKYIDSISVVGRELLSLEVEGREWTTQDTMTFHSGALVPNDGVKKIRKETVDFLVELYKTMPGTKERLAIMKAMLTGFSVPHNTAYGDDVIELIQEDSKRLAGILSDILYPANTTVIVADFSIAQEVDEALVHLLRGERFRTPETTALYERLLADELYARFSTLVGDIQEFRNLEEDWQVAEMRRTAEIQALVDVLSEANFPEWYKHLNAFAQPLQDGVIDEWKFTSYKSFVSLLTATKPEIANKFFSQALAEKLPLCHSTFVTPYLSALRRAGDLESWDSFVALINKERVADLPRSIAFSLNLDADTDLDSQIRQEDLDALAQLVRGQTPFDYADTEDVNLRYAMINTLSRLFPRDAVGIEKLIIEEIKGHKKLLNLYMRELPFASTRKWMTFQHWSPEGIAFIKESLIELSELDWHVQGMMLELGSDPIELILDVFKERSKHTKDALGIRFEEIPYHFNPELQKYLTEHEKYTEEMVKWLKEMTPEWSTYNWHLTHFIQRIGGASYAAILKKLIEEGDDESLKRASYALRASDHADFDLCMEVVSRTDNEDILSDIYAALAGMGVVSGEDGMALAYEGKAQALEKYLTSEDERIKAYAAKTKKSFEQQATAERERSSTRKKVRKLEFDGP